MSTQLETAEDGVNPLDSVEDVLVANNWTFNRMNNDELMVQVIGKACEYRLFFLWQADMSALQFCCQYDLQLDKSNYEQAAAALSQINETLWMGHFDLPKETMTPSFRQTCLMRGIEKGVANPDHIEDLVDISLAQCERYYHVFHLLSEHAANHDEDGMSLALMEVKGES